MKKLDQKILEKIIGGISGGECALVGAAMVATAGVFTFIVYSLLKDKISECWNS